MADERPKPYILEDGRKVVFPLWREDIAEATIFPRKESDAENRSKLPESK